MTPRRLAIAALVAVVIVGGLALGLRWLTSGGAALPSSAATTGLSSPSASRLTIGLPRPDLTPGAINPAATQDNLSATVCKSGWATSVRPPSAYTSALKLAQIVEYGYSDKSPSRLPGRPPRAARAGGAATRSDGTSGPSRTTPSHWPTERSIGGRQGQDLEDALHRRGVFRNDAPSGRTASHRPRLDRRLGGRGQAVVAAILRRCGDGMKRSTTYCSVRTRRCSPRPRPGASRAIARTVSRTPAAVIAQWNDARSLCSARRRWPADPSSTTSDGSDGCRRTTASRSLNVDVASTNICAPSRSRAPRRSGASGPGDR